jgi:branched-chain amino acid transport system permease protein
MSGRMDGRRGQLALPAGVIPARLNPLWRARTVIFVIAYLVLIYFIAQSSLTVRSLGLVAAVFSILAISLDLVAGMLGLYSLGQGGFFAIGAYLTTIVATRTGVDIFLLLPLVFIATGIGGAIIGAMSLRVSGLYFAITTFVFTLVLTVLATDLSITGGLQGLLGPAFPDFPDALDDALGASLAWCVMLLLLAAIVLAWSIRKSPLYPVLLAIRDAEPFAEAAGIRTAVLKIGVFGLSAAMAGTAGWLFSFLGVVSPGQFDWSVSLNILVMVLVGGINTTFGPIVGAIFVTMFPAVVNIDPWLQEILYGALSIIAITMFPEGVVGLLKNRLGGRFRTATAAAGTTEEPAPIATPVPAPAVGRAGEAIIECRGIEFGYGVGPKVLRNVDLEVKRGHIHGLIGPNGSGKSTLANIIAGRLRQQAGNVLVKGVRADGLAPSARAGLGLRRTFQAAQLVKELPTSRNVMVGLFSEVPRIVPRAAVWPLLPSGARDGARMLARARQALRTVGAGDWVDAKVGDVPHGIEQLTQLASVRVAGPDIIVLDEPATGLSISEVDELARLLGQLKAQGVTMIIIEHQTRFLFPLCDQVTVLNAGEVIMTGTADEVRANPVVRQIYLGE